MIKKQKGGIETIIAVIILAGIVVALLIGPVMDVVGSGNNVANSAVDSLERLDTQIS